MTTHLSALTIIRIYLTAVLRWALFGAATTYVLLLGVFTLVGYTEGLAFSLLPVPGFFALSMGVGAFLGGASGVEVGQIEVERRAAQLKRRSQALLGGLFLGAHPARRDIRSLAECTADPQCAGFCEHKADRDDYVNLPLDPPPAPAESAVWRNRPFTQAEIDEYN